MATNAARAPAELLKRLTGGPSQAVSSWLVVKRSRPLAGTESRSASTWVTKVDAGALSQTALSRLNDAQP